MHYVRYKKMYSKISNKNKTFNLKKIIRVSLDFFFYLFVFLGESLSALSYSLSVTEQKLLPIVTIFFHLFLSEISSNILKFFGLIKI